MDNIVDTCLNNRTSVSTTARRISEKFQCLEVALQGESLSKGSVRGMQDDDKVPRREGSDGRSPVRVKKSEDHKERSAPWGRSRL